MCYYPNPLKNLQTNNNWNVPANADKVAAAKSTSNDNIIVILLPNVSAKLPHIADPITIPEKFQIS